MGLITWSKPDASTAKNAAYNAALSAVGVGTLFLLGRFATSKLAVVNLTNFATTVGTAFALGTFAQGTHTAFADGKANSKRKITKLALLASTLIGTALFLSCKPLTSRISLLKGPVTSGLLVGTASAISVGAIRLMWHPETANA